MVTKIILVWAVTVIAACLTGMLYTKAAGEKRNTLALNLMAGILMLWAVFQLMAVPCIFMKISFSVFTRVYTGVIVLLCLLSVILNRKSILFSWKDRIEGILKSPKIMAVVVMILLLQMFMYVRYVHVDGDDAFYVATAVTTESTDTMYQVNPYTGEAYKSFPMRYVMSPFPVFISYLARVFQVHPTIMAHTILPVILVTAGFCVLCLLGQALFPEDRKKATLFVMFCQVIQLFSGFNVYQPGMFYLIRIWQGKAVLAAVLLPFCFYIGKKLMGKNMKTADWLLTASLMLSCSMVSSMGIMLGAISMGILGIIAAFYQKSPGILIKTALCCIPNVVYALIYVIN